MLYNILITICVVAFIICLCCDDRWWRSKREQYTEQRDHILHWANLIGSFTFVWVIIKLILDSKTN